MPGLGLGRGDAGWGNAPRALRRPQTVQAATGEWSLVAKPVTVPYEEEFIAVRTTKAVVPNTSGSASKGNEACSKPECDVAKQDTERHGNDD